MNIFKKHDEMEELAQLAESQACEIYELKKELNKLKEELQEVKKFNAKKVYDYLGKYPDKPKTKMHGFNHDLINKIVRDQVEMRLGSTYQEFKSCRKNLFKSYTENQDLEEKYEKLADDYKDMKITYLELLERFNRE